MKSMEKYFLALVPPTEILQKAHAIKEEIRDKFGIKYALKSPPHITLKMPFTYNEAKEDFLTGRLEEFLKLQKPFQVKVIGVGTFGNRVVFLDIQKSDELEYLQSSLKSFCKKELNLVDELSDRNYHPHMTIAFKDLKPGSFVEVLDLVKKRGFQTEFCAAEIVLLKRIEGRWIQHKTVPFGDDFLVKN